MSIKHQLESDKKLIDVKKACDRFGYSEGRMRQLIGKHLQRYKDGRRTLIDLAEVIIHYNSLSPANRAKIGSRKHLSVNKAGELQGVKDLMKPVVTEIIK